MRTPIYRAESKLPQLTSRLLGWLGTKQVWITHNYGWQPQQLRHKWANQAITNKQVGWTSPNASKGGMHTLVPPNINMCLAPIGTQLLSDETGVTILWVPLNQIGTASLMCVCHEACHACFFLILRMWVTTCLSREIQKVFVHVKLPANPSRSKVSNLSF